MGEVQGRGAGVAARAKPFTYDDFSLKTPPVVAAPAGVVAGAGAGPERCCVYCGHALFAAPRVVRVRCPKCFQEMPARDVVIGAEAIGGEGHEPRYVTAGKITVAADVRVAAELVACRVDIAGWVLGEVLASQICWVRRSGKVAGRILCRRLEVEPGAHIEGHVELIRG